jgi:L-galactose dehydrogenase/L-glyceraldehyde 3-phosphate reductase
VEATRSRRKWTKKCNWGRSVEYRTLGKTGIRVSAIGFGCGGNAQLMVGDDEALRLATIAAALEAGIDYFDTAAAYGDGSSERNLGRALAELGAEPVISTKVVLQEEDLADPRSAVLRKFDEGLSRLGRDRVDALMLHNRVFVAPKGGRHAVGSQLSLDHIFAANGVAAAFGEIVDSGRSTISGFTSYGGDVAAIEEMIGSGAFGALNASVNLLNPSAVVEAATDFPLANYGRAAAKAAEAGMGVMAIQVLARGVFTGAGPTEGRDGEVAGVARSCDLSLAGVSTRYALSKAAISTVILGLSEPAHVVDAVAALERGPLTAEQIDALEAFTTGPGGS